MISEDQKKIPLAESANFSSTNFTELSVSDVIIGLGEEGTGLNQLSVFECWENTTSTTELEASTSIIKWRMRSGSHKWS